MNTIKKITHSGELQIGDMKVPCYVTQDGTRLMSSGKVAQLLESGSEGGVSRSSQKAPKIINFLSSESLKPFVDKALTGAPSSVILTPIRALFPPKVAGKGNIIINGYVPEAFTAICKAMIDAKQADALVSNKQRFIAKQCELIRDALAWGVGLTALIDEATGYQYDRAHNYLATIFDNYMAKELQPWAKMFPNEFWEEIARLTGYFYNRENGGRHPSMGKIVNDFIYESFPEGKAFLKALRRLNPVVHIGDNGIGVRNARHHQWLTSDVGKLVLKERINLCVNIMKGHYDWKSFSRHWWRLMAPKEFKLA